MRSKTVTSVQRMIFQVGQTEAETKCSCLPRTQVEDNLINGVNPLGLNSKQCYQVPSDMIYLNTKNGIKRYKSISIFLLFLNIIRHQRHSLDGDYRRVRKY